MTPTTPADASPAAGEVVAWRWRVEPWPFGMWGYQEDDPTGGFDSGWPIKADPLVLKSLLDASRAETDAAKRDAFVIRGNDAVGHLAEAKGRIVVLSDLLDAANARAEALNVLLKNAADVMQPFAEAAQAIPDEWPADLKIISPAGKRPVTVGEVRNLSVCLTEIKGTSL